MNRKMAFTAKRWRSRMSALARLSWASLMIAGIITPLTSYAEEAQADGDSTIAGCLKAFGNHPFGAKPKYKTLAVSVKVFGIGKDTVDDEITTSPALILIRPGVNVMGGNLIDLRNPQGWYCMQTSVNVMGGLNIKLACNAKFVMAGEETSVMSQAPDNKGITVMGKTTVERDCQ